MNIAVSRARVMYDALIQVKALDDLIYLIKEYEVLTAKPGRTFKIGLSGRRLIWIRLEQDGIEVSEADHRGPIRQEYVPLAIVGEHSIGKAIRDGALYTVPFEPRNRHDTRCHQPKGETKPHAELLMVARQVVVTDGEAHGSA